MRYLIGASLIVIMLAGCGDAKTAANKAVDAAKDTAQKDEVSVENAVRTAGYSDCLLYTSPSPRD